jgi:hypothetical protein
MIVVEAETVLGWRKKPGYRLRRTSDGATTVVAKKQVLLDGNMVVKLYGDPEWVPALCDDGNIMVSDEGAWDYLFKDKWQDNRRRN